MSVAEDAKCTADSPLIWNGFCVELDKSGIPFVDVRPKTFDSSWSRFIVVDRIIVTVVPSVWRLESP